MKHDPFLTLKNREHKKINDSFIKHHLQNEEIKLLYIENLVDETENPYPITELNELVESIKQHGLEQNLVVKEIEKNMYTIISGHRRFAAIKYILNNDTENEYQQLEEIYCKIIDSNEDEIITRLRLHETNFQNRHLLKLKEEDKLKIIDDYLKWLNLARVNNILINGKEIKGTTKDILAQQFNISPRTASRLMANVKGVPNGTPPQKEVSMNDKLKKIHSLITKLMNNIDEVEEELSLIDRQEMIAQFESLINQLKMASEECKD